MFSAPKQALANAKRASVTQRSAGPDPKPTPATPNKTERAEADSVDCEPDFTGVVQLKRTPANSKRLWLRSSRSRPAQTLVLAGRVRERLGRSGFRLVVGAPNGYGQPKRIKKGKEQGLGSVWTVHDRKQRPEASVARASTVPVPPNRGGGDDSVHFWWFSGHEGRAKARGLLGGATEVWL